MEKASFDLALYFFVLTGDGVEYQLGFIIWIWAELVEYRSP